jgi:hypothetical protein
MDDYSPSAFTIFMINQLESVSVVKELLRTVARKAIYVMDEHIKVRLLLNYAPCHKEIWRN